MANFCPVCWRPVYATPKNVIFGHFDKHPTRLNSCPGSFEPFDITLKGLATGRNWLDMAGKAW